MKLLKKFHPWGEMSPETKAPVGFIDGFSKNHGVADIIKSTDLGKTWTNLPGKGTPEFFGPTFGAPAFFVKIRHRNCMQISQSYQGQCCYIRQGKSLFSKNEEF